jgi:DNA repair protein RadC
MTKVVEGPRERAVTDGMGALGTTDLVALVLGTGHAGMPVMVAAAALVDASGGVDGLARAGLGELVARVGPAKGARLAAAIELGRRAAEVPSGGERLDSSRAVDAWARPRLAALDHEELWVVAVDGHQRIRAARRVAMGGLHGVHVAVRDPLRVAIREAGSAFLLVHNHPSGDPAPSAEDVAFTQRLARAADELGTPLLDHVVIARGGYVSMLDRGELGPSAGDAG